MRHFEYDLDGIDINDSSRIALLAFDVRLWPYIDGLFDQLLYESRHVDDDSYQTTQGIVKYLREGFMAWNEDIVTTLQEIRDAILAGNSSLLDGTYGINLATWVYSLYTATQGVSGNLAPLARLNLDLPGIKSALQGIDSDTDSLSCICDLSSLQYTLDQAGSDAVDDAETDGIIDGGLPAQNEPDTLTVDQERCDTAQVLWYLIYEYVGEIAIPLAEKSFSIIVGLLLGTWAASFAVVFEGLGLSSIAFFSFVADILDIIKDGAGASLLNWLFAAKDEIICALYRQDLDEVHGLIDDSDLSAATKASLKHGAFTEPMLWLAQQIALYGSALAWRDDRIESSACDSCFDAGCFDFCDEDWTIAGCGTLDEGDCTLENGCASNQQLAYRSVDLDGNVDIGVWCEKVFDAAYNFEIKLLQGGSPVWTWKPITDSGYGYTETTTTGITSGTYELAIYGISGTATVYHAVCVSG